MTKAKQTTKTAHKDDRGMAQRDDALRSYEKAMELQAHLTATPRLKEKQASMRRDHPKPKYRER